MLEDSPNWEAALGAIFTLAREESVLEVRVGGDVVFSRETDPVASDRVITMFKRKRQVARVQDLMREDTTPRRAEPPPVPPAPQPDLEHLEAEVRYHRDRLRLYRQRIVSAKPTSPSRLRELERVSAAAVERLRTARQA